MVVSSVFVSMSSVSEAERLKQERDDALFQRDQAKTDLTALSNEHARLTEENKQLKAQQREAEGLSAQLEEKDYRIRELEEQNRRLDAYAAAHDDRDIVAR